MLRCQTISLFPILVAITMATTLAEEPTKLSETRQIAHRRAGAGEPGSGERQREGTRLTDVVGRFELAGERVTFYPANQGAAGKESYRLLENLALERVGQVLSESRARQDWTISGTLTEFRGANYLLLQKAVIKSAPPAN